MALAPTVPRPISARPAHWDFETSAKSQTGKQPAQTNGIEA
jgi:hypothetical protein